MLQRGQSDQSADRSRCPCPTLPRRVCSPSDEPRCDQTGSTALMYAAAFATPEIIRLLLEAGADVKADLTED